MPSYRFVGLREDDETGLHVLPWVERHVQDLGGIPEGYRRNAAAHALLRVTSLTPAAPPHPAALPRPAAPPAAVFPAGTVSPASLTNRARSPFIVSIPLL